MSAHTPGPWKADESNATYLEARIYPKGRRTMIALCNAAKLDTLTANARLIAAAPELLAALEAAEGALASFIDGNTSPDLRACVGIHDFALAAIAKAKGEA